MARVSLSTLSSKCIAIAFLLSSVFVAIVLDVGSQDSGITSVAVAQHEDAPADADSMSLMQGVLLVDRAIVHEKGSSSEAQLALLETLATETDDSEVPVKSKETLLGLSQTTETDNSEVPVQSKPQAPVQSKLQAKLSFLALSTSSLHESAHLLGVEIAHRLGVKTGVGITIMFILVCVTMLTCVAAVLLRMQGGKRNDHGQFHPDIAAAIEKRELMLAHTSPAFRDLCASNLSGMPGRSGMHTPAPPSSQYSLRCPPPGSQHSLYSSALPGSQCSLPTSQLPGNIYAPNCSYQRISSGLSVTGADPFDMSLEQSLRTPLSPIYSSPDPWRTPSTAASLASLPGTAPSLKATPPPLCPTLAMPRTETLLGIPMYELANLTHQEGSLNIVGVSGKPLLRAEVRNSMAQLNSKSFYRVLEISMPQSNSIPRAYVGPPKWSEHSSSGSRVLEIRGVQGTLYGILQMGSAGACYVVKDGQNVLDVDGDAESLQLRLKSSGCDVATVRCSTEQFDGEDHVELRLEPGTDAVLVAAVVLSVLLLSPYLAPAYADDDDSDVGSVAVL